MQLQIWESSYFLLSQIFKIFHSYPLKSVKCYSLLIFWDNLFLENFHLCSYVIINFSIIKMYFKTTKFEKQGP